MSRAAARAFGHYMRTLRERRGLSALAVCRLIAGTSERIDRGSLWRLENGKHGLSMGKLTALGRIYDATPEVIGERLELDRELEHLGGPPTENLAPAELVERGCRALTGQGTKWDAYAFLREASACARAETQLRTRLNLATAMRSLGKNRLALHELLELEPAARGTRLHAIVLDRIANCHRCLGNLGAAGGFAEQALAESKGSGDGRMKAFVLNTLANIALARGEPATAVERLERALRTSRDPRNANGALRPSPGFEVTSRNMLAEGALLCGRPEAAKRAAGAAGKIARRYGIPAGVAGSELLLGQIDELDRLHARAEDRWQRVIAIAGQAGHRRLAFAAEYYRFRRATRAGETAKAAAGRRRLERLAPWVPPHVPVVAQFREMTGAGTLRGGPPGHA